jgi:hypothetical protein
MKQQKGWWLSGAVFGAVFLMTTLVSPAQQVFRETINMQRGAGQVIRQDLGVGDTVVFTLQNPTNQPLVFETKYPLAGNVNQWEVPANSTRTVTYEYIQPFSDDITYFIRPVAGGANVAEGVLVPREVMANDQPAAGAGQRQAAAPGEEPGMEPTPMEVAQEPGGGPGAQGTEENAMVRGYW